MLSAISTGLRLGVTLSVAVITPLIAYAGIVGILGLITFIYEWVKGKCRNEK